MAPGPAAAMFPDWPQYSARLTAAIAGLRPEELARRSDPDHAPVWMLAAHVAGSRLYWLCLVCGEDGIDSTPVLDPTTGAGWDDDEDHPRTAEELVGALDASWAVVARCLDGWTPAMLAGVVERRLGDVTQQHTRISILNRLLSHDAFHAGEMSQLLGTGGRPGIDLWARPRR